MKTRPSDKIWGTLGDAVPQPPWDLTLCGIPVKLGKKGRTKLVQPTLRFTYVVARVASQRGPILLVGNSIIA